MREPLVDAEWVRAALVEVLLRMSQHVTLAVPITSANLSGLAIPELVGAMDAAVDALLAERAILLERR